MTYAQRMVTGCMLSFYSGLTSWATEEPAWLNPEWGPLSTSVHIIGAVGHSSGDPEELASGHHDPSREDGTAQGIELGLSLRLEQLEGFATYNTHFGADEEWESEWEEAFLKVRDLPGGFEARGGRMLGRFGQQNNRHLHAWHFVDTPLVLGRFLGENGLLFDGGDITWLSQGVGSAFGIILGYGKSKAHEHTHEHEDEHADHHDDEDEHEQDEDIAFAKDVASGRLFAQFQQNDFRMYEGGMSLAVGDEEAGRRVMVYGLDTTFTWRENGLGPDGRAFVWMTELLYRDVDSGGFVEGHVEDSDHLEVESNHDHEHASMPGGAEFGFYSAAHYTLNARLDLGLRVGYVEGNCDLGTDERFQVSPAVTIFADPYRRTQLRFQYNYDDLAGGAVEHSVWVQLGLSWGGDKHSDEAHHGACSMHH